MLGFLIHVRPQVPAKEVGQGQRIRVVRDRPEEDRAEVGLPEEGRGGEGEASAGRGLTS